MASGQMDTDPDFSLIIPVFNEAESIRPTVEEAVTALAATPQRHEIILVNDGSTDGTPRILDDLYAQYPDVIRVLSMKKNSGQSAAFGAGFRHCRGVIVVLMDGDGQNDPHDIPRLIESIATCDACCGYRAVRKDTIYRRWGSRLANAVRSGFIHDGIRDTGCSLKAIRREFLTDIPMTFKGMHRFLPAFILMQGGRINQVPVNHRARTAGRSKYTNLGRLKETVFDLLAVRWMQSRYRDVGIGSRKP